MDKYKQLDVVGKETLRYMRVNPHLSTTYYESVYQRIKVL